MASIYRLHFDSSALKESLSRLDPAVANGLVSAVDDGVFERFVRTEKVLDVLLEGDSRAPVVPFAKTARIEAAATSYADAYSDERHEVVILASVLQRVENPISTIGFAYDQLELGGYLIVSLPHRDLFERRLNAPSRQTQQHHRFYTLDTLIQHIQAACGLNSVRLRFAKEYDKGHNYDDLRGRPSGEFSIVAVFEKIGRGDRYDDVSQIEVKRIGDFKPPAHEAVRVANVADALAAGLTMSDVKRILVMKLDHLGDFAMMAPSFEELRAMFPSAEITLVCGPWNRPFAEKTGLFDRIVECEYYKQDEKFGGQSDDRKAIEAQRLGTALSGDAFDLAIDFRVPPDGRRLLEFVDARVKAGVGTVAEFPFLDIALPSMEAFYQGLQSIPEQAEIGWSASAFRYHGRHSVQDGVAVCNPSDDGFFVSGPYVRLGAGRYVGSFNLRLLGPHVYQSAFVWCDIAASAGEVLYAREVAITEDSAVCEFEFDAFVDLKDVEFRVRLAETPVQPPSFVFLGVKMSFMGATTARRLLPLASVHIAEHATLLLALVRSRLSRSGATRELIERLAGPSAATDAEASDSEPAASEPYIAVAPYSNSVLRDWPTDQYRDLIRSILSQTTARIKLLGSKAQMALLGKLAERVTAEGDDGDRLEVATGLDLPQVFGVMANAVTTITNNSGLAHVAATLGARSISVYSGSHQAIEWGPLGRNSVTLQSGLDCGPCGYDRMPECQHGHRCMRLISAAEVMTALKAQAADLFVGAEGNPQPA